ncbi:MAG TPA: 4Fe-4S binding protein [Firmicutes bacterium]|nr:4Fe-4S binding protein [Bacillota bacterium]
MKQEWCKGCGICVSFCPREALSLNRSNKAELNAARCTGCGTCEMYCPDFAIELREEGGSNERS